MAPRPCAGERARGAAGGTSARLLASSCQSIADLAPGRRMTAARAQTIAGRNGLSCPGSRSGSDGSPVGGQWCPAPHARSVPDPNAAKRPLSSRWRSAAVRPSPRGKPQPTPPQRMTHGQAGGPMAPPAAQRSADLRLGQPRPQFLPVVAACRRHPQQRDPGLGADAVDEGVAHFPALLLPMARSSSSTASLIGWSADPPARSRGACWRPW